MKTVFGVTAALAAATAALAMASNGTVSNVTVTTTTVLHTTYLPFEQHPCSAFSFADKVSPDQACQPGACCIGIAEPTTTVVMTKTDYVTKTVAPASSMPPPLVVPDDHDCEVIIVDGKVVDTLPGNELPPASEAEEEEYQDGDEEEEAARDGQGDAQDGAESTPVAWKGKIKRESERQARYVGGRE